MVKKLDGTLIDLSDNADASIVEIMASLIYNASEGVTSGNKGTIYHEKIY